MYSIRNLSLATDPNIVSSSSSTTTTSSSSAVCCIRA
jgi:hypothetical protein